MTKNHAEGSKMEKPITFIAKHEFVDIPGVLNFTVRCATPHAERMLIKQLSELPFPAEAKSGAGSYEYGARYFLVTMGAINV